MPIYMKLEALDANSNRDTFYDEWIELQSFSPGPDLGNCQRTADSMSPQFLRWSAQGRTNWTKDRVDNGITVDLNKSDGVRGWSMRFVFKDAVITNYSMSNQQTAKPSESFTIKGQVMVGYLQL
ncbi:MAG TPA: hypothetical protein VML19_31580 [Verrucomicrobiae bacterium]|nr:hypothetical protein [Verrucomicrobiae bacterium]